MNVTIEPALGDDVSSIRRLYGCAFPSEEAEQVADLAVELLQQAGAFNVVSLVARFEPNPGSAADASSQAGLVGHIAFSPVSIPDVAGWQGYLLSPLAVMPAFHRTGIGTRLIEEGIGKLREMGVEMILVYGDPGYYGRFGFDAGIARRYKPPHPLEFPHGWLGKCIREPAHAEPGDPDAACEPAPITCVAPLNDPALW